MPETIYDVAIIGSGPAGYTAAIRAGQLGLKAALIEKADKLGGTCLHVGCIPTKALLFNAEVYDHVKEGAELGLENTSGVTLNWGAIQKRKQGIVDKHAKGLQFLMKKNKVDVVRGYGKLTGPAKDGIHTVALEGGEQKSIKAKNVILSTGSVARMLPGMEPDSRILTNIEVLSLNDIPKSLIVIGSGAVGVEFASIYKSFGADVTILEMLPRYVPVEDEEVSKELMRVYRKRGINGFVNAKVEKVEKTTDGVAVTFSVDGKQQKLEAEKVLVAVGRAPRTEGVGIEKTKIQLERGFVKIDQYMRTDEPGIYAVGDIVVGYPQDDQARANSQCNILPSGNRQRRSDRSQGQGKGLRRQDWQVPLHCQLARQHRGPARRLHQNCYRRQVWRDSGRTHYRAERDGADCRVRGGAGDGMHRGRAGEYHPCASYALGGDAGCRQRCFRYGN